MAKGKRPTQQSSSPIGRWAMVIVGLVIVGGVVWWVAGSSSDEPASGEVAEDGTTAPAPLDVEGGAGPTVEEAATLDAPPDSITSGGPDVPTGIDVSNDPKRGSASAPVTIVEFSDFQCPFCGRFHRETFPALQRLYGDQVRWIFVNYPIAGHEWGEPAAIAGECAARQGRFWEFADQVFGNQERLSGDFLRKDVPAAIGVDAEAYLACMNNRETASEVAADLAEAKRVGVGATPTFYVNGIQVVGAQPPGVFNEIIGPYFAR